MVDLSIITASLQSIKTATEIAKLLKETDISLEKAELKLKIADLISALVDTRINLASIQELILEKDKKIEEIQEALKIKGEIIRHNDAYYLKNDSGEPCGSPFCSHCWESNNKLIHLHTSNLNVHQCICPVCKNIFLRRKARDLQDNESDV